MSEPHVIAELYRKDAERIIDEWKGKAVAGQEAPIEVKLAYICLSKCPPPNPLYRAEWVVSLDAGHANISVPMPGNQLSRDDAEHLIANMELIIRQLKRKTGIGGKAGEAQP